MNSNQVKIDKNLTMAQAHAVIAAYSDYNGEAWNSPKGYDFVDRFSGWGTLATVKTNALYGLVFRSQKSKNDYLIAFRGTQSYTDIYNDLWANLVPFKPLAPIKPLKFAAKVADGFFSIYSDQGPKGQPSMREQVVDILGDLDEVGHIAVCGHSLGGTFASMCALDLKMLKATKSVQCTSFASPAVGNTAWEDAYENMYDLKKTSVRIYNYWDIVPTLPPLYTFKHVGQPFQINTKVKAWIDPMPHYQSRHSMDNYAIVLSHAVKNTPQVWEGEYPDATHDGWTMISDKPISTPQPQWAMLLMQIEDRPKAFEAVLEMSDL